MIDSKLAGDAALSGIKAKQAKFLTPLVLLVRVTGVEPARRAAPDPKGSVTLVKDFLLAQHHAYVLNFTGYYACETKEIATRDYGLTYGYYYKLSKIVFNA